MKNISILKHRIFLKRHDLIEGLEIYENDILKYYSYSYKIWERGNKAGIIKSNDNNKNENTLDRKPTSGSHEKDELGYWRPLIRWDNYEEKPHVDVYGENQNLLQQHPLPERKTLKEVIELVRIFRRNLVAMNVAEM